MTAAGAGTTVAAGPVVAAVCRVVWTDPAAVAADAVDLLDAAERERLSALRRPADRQRFLAAHALLRLVLGQELGTAPADLRFAYRCATCGGPHGKPALAPAPHSVDNQPQGVTRPVAAHPQFSISHAGDRVVIAVASAPVGVDVEVPVPGLDVTEFAAVALSPVERAALAGSPPDERADAVLRTWVRKEAVLKATGRGLAVPPDRVEVSPAGAPPALVAWTAEDPPRDICLADLDLGSGAPAALAVLAPRIASVEVIRWPGPGRTFASPRFG